MRPTRVWLAAAGAVALYLAVAVATMGLSGHRLLPLFEGVGPPSPYRWVHPPSQFAASNSKPSSLDTLITFAGPTSAAGVIETPDAQFVLNLSAGALPRHGADTGVRAVIVPLDPATLGSPPGLSADGNAYRVTFTYQPSGTPLATIAAPSNLVMTAPHGAATILYSADGRAWTRLATTYVGSPTVVGGSFADPGWYLVGYTPPAATTTTGGGTGGGNNTVAVALGVAGGAAVAGVLALVFFRRRR